MPNPSRSFEERAVLRAFGERVRQERLARDWTQEQLAAAAGLDRGYISAVEHGHRNVSLNAIGCIARGLGLSIADLFAF